MAEPAREALAALGNGPLHRFADWPSADVPNLRAGVYTIWDDAGSLIYVGMAGKGLVADPPYSPPDGLLRRRGLLDRLHSHASGRRSGDQFCMYVFDRLVLPELTPGEISAAASATLSLDARVRDYIRGHLSYRFAVTADGVTALATERAVRRGGLTGRKPLLNPL